METIEKIQTRHKETLKTFDSILSVLAPISFDNKTFFVDDINIERLAKSSDFLSNEFCGVCVMSERTGTPGTGTDKTTHKIKLTGENFGYEIDPGALPHLKKNIEKSFKAVESFTKKESKATHPAKVQNPAEPTERPKIDELRAEIKRKEETARHLYGNKKGPAWGLKTTADEKRADEISNLKSRLSNIETAKGLIKNDSMLIKDSNKLQKDSKKAYICKESESKKHTERNEEVNENPDELKTVNFQIEGKFIDEIKAGTKLEDYRAINPVNAKKLCDHIDKKDLKPGEQFVTHFKEIWRLKKDITHVRFFNGYQTERKELLIELKGLELNHYVKEIPKGMKPGTFAFTLILGQIVVSKNFTS